MNMKVLQEAVNKGYSLIPVKDKKPLINWEVYQSRRATLGEVLSWNTRFPNCQYGIVTGPISNLFVVDVDDTTISLTLPPTHTVTTARGFHHYFKWSAALNNKVTTKTDIQNKVDARGDGGYCVGWKLEGLPLTSMLADAPQWVMDLLPNKFERPKFQAKPDDWAIDALNNLTMGNRNATFASVAGRYWRKGLTKNEIRSILIPYANDVKFTLEELETIIGSITRYDQQDQKVEIRSLKNSKEDYQRKVRERGKFKVPELSTGYRQFDQATWGLRRGDVVTIGARTGVGKTCLCVSIASTLVSSGKRVIYISTEMSYDQVFDRFIACTAEVDAFNLSIGKSSAEDTAKVDQFLRDSDKYDFNIYDGFEPDLKSVKEIVEEHRPDVVFFDHIQHIGSSGDNQTRDLEKFIKGLKDIAREFSVAIVVASQLKDPPITKFKDQIIEDRPPVLGDIKWCKAIAEESSQVLLLSRLGADDSSEMIPVIANLAKNRSGAQRFFELQLNKKFTKFVEVI